jgi:predicted transcriptional regulator
MSAPSHPVDERILEYFGENPPEYIPLVANRLGVHLQYAEKRVDVLVEKGLLKPVSNEVIYTITEVGERVLEGETTMRNVAREATSDD